MKKERQIMFIDTHLDTLWAMNKQKREFYELSKLGHVDLPRAQKANLLCGFFTGYPTDSAFVTEKMLANWIQMVNDHRNKIRKITKIKHLQQLVSDRKGISEKEREIGVVLHLEGAAGIDTELNRLHIFYEIGLRSMSLTWNEENQFATGQEQGENRGLTIEGKDLLSAMEDLGIIIDVSHLNDRSFWDVINNTNSPIMASHSNVREIADHKRNLTRDMVQAIHDTKGSIGVNLYKGFLSTNPDDARSKDAVKMFGEIIQITDVNTIHMGADLDGADLPDDILDITSIPGLFNNIQTEFSLSDVEMKKIKTENVIRIMKKIWK